jgi:methionine synthase II (cobalamin-independent)
MTFDPNFWTTLVGSFSHTEYEALYDRLATGFDIPVWPQLSRRNFRENMYVMYSRSIPRLVLDEANEKITVDTSGDITPALESFYERYLADDLDAFALTPSYATGFFELLARLENIPGEWVKGHVTGPVSFGLTVTDQDLRPALYHELLADVIVKNMVMIARWQIRELAAVRPKVIIFVDEPYMASFGSAYISLSREQVVVMLDEVFDAIHQEGVLAAVHCCANTDWSVLMETKVDILNLDAYGYLENLALYPEELRAFLDRGGVIAWGIVPNTEEIHAVTPESLAQKLHQGIALISAKARARGVDIRPEEFARRSLITPSCGLGPTTVEIADQAMDVLARTGEFLQQG